MRFVTFIEAGTERLGLQRGEEVVDLRAVDPDAPGTMVELLGRAEEGLAAATGAAEKAPASARRPLARCERAPPIPRPGKIICLGLNYFDHALEGGLTERPQHPIVFLRTATSLTPHEGVIERPACSERLDYEGELVAVIGRPGRGIATEDALDHVAGYSIFNDGSVRDYQLRTPQWTMGKNFDRTGGFGPAFVTADELPPGASGLRIETRLNGQVMQSANTRDMIFGVAEAVSLMSEAMTLEAGDILVMGTPAGIGSARRPQVWMKAGDVCEIEIEAVGLLRNRIVDQT